MRRLLILAIMLVSFGTAKAQFFSQEGFTGALFGGLTGGIIGHNNGRHGAEGAAIGAGVGWLVGDLVHASREREYYNSRPYYDYSCGVGYHSPRHFGGYYYAATPPAGYYTSPGYYVTPAPPPVVTVTEAPPQSQPVTQPASVIVKPPGVMSGANSLFGR